MRTENATLVAAVIAALAGVGGIAVSSVSNLYLESRRWEQTREDNLRVERGKAVSEFAQLLSAAAEKASLLTFKAAAEPELLSAKDTEAYDQAINDLLLRLISAQINVASHDKSLNQQLSKLRVHFLEIDAKVNEAARDFLADNKTGAPRLGALHEEARLFSHGLPDQFAELLSNPPAK